MGTKVGGRSDRDGGIGMVVIKRIQRQNNIFNDTMIMKERGRRLTMEGRRRGKRERDACK